MATGMIGADPESMRAVATIFDDSAEQLTGSAATVTGALDDAPWNGSDAEQFRNWWTSTGARALESAADLVRSAGDALRLNADAQEQTSAADGAGGAIGTGLGAGGRAGLGDRVGITHDGSSFEDEVYGQEPLPVDLELADLADFDTPPEGWSELDMAEFEAAGIDPASLDRDSGLSAEIYRDAEGNHVLAFKGTDEGADWLDNIVEGTGLNGRQNNEAVMLAKQAEAAFGDDLVITGHSLGGRLASLAALATDSPAVTFNAAGLHDNSMEAAGIDPATARARADDGLIRRYSVAADPVTRLQEDADVMHVVPDAVGAHIELPDPDPPPWYRPDQRIVRLGNHDIDVVQEAMRNDPRFSG